MIFQEQRIPLRDKTNLYLYHQNRSITAQLVAQKKGKVTHQNTKYPEEQNNHQQTYKKVKLKLRVASSQQLYKKQEPDSKFTILKQKSKQIKTNKDINKKQPATKKEHVNLVNCYFKPNTICLSLNQQHLSNQLGKNTEVKQKKVKQNVKTQNYSLSGFLAQISYSFVEMFHDIRVKEIKLTNFTSHSFIYSELISFLYSLSMIKYANQRQYRIQCQEQKQQLQKIYLLWKILKSSTNQCPSQMNVVNISILLASIMNIQAGEISVFTQIFFDKISHFILKNKQNQRPQIESKQVQGPSHIFFIRNKKLLTFLDKVTFKNQDFFKIGTQMQHQIAKEFQIFRINRLKTQNTLKSSTQHPENDSPNKQMQLNFLISPKSQELALTKRLKILQELQKSQQGYSLPMKNLSGHLQLNIFLNYKSPKMSVVGGQDRRDKPTQVQGCRSKPSSNLFIPSQKVRFSQLKSILKMQRGRQIKLQKKHIIQKGWTNSGQTSRKLSAITSTRSSSQSKNKNKNPPFKQPSCSSLNKNNQSDNKYFIRKHNAKEQEAGDNIQMLISQNYHKQLECRLSKRFTTENQFVLQDYQQKQKDQRFKYHSEQNSNHTMSIDEDESINLEDLNFDYENQFITQKSCKQIDRIQEPIMTSFIVQSQHLSEDTKENFGQNMKTFNTQINEQTEEFTQEKRPNQNTITKEKQSRVIKSYLKIPILYVDVNMDESKKQRIVIFEQDNSIDLARKFGLKHNLDRQMVRRLQEMLGQQINGILGRIDQEQEEYDEAEQENSLNKRSLK